jgi:hypothetical protein
MKAEDAAQAFKFTHAFLQYVYTLPHQVMEASAKRTGGQPPAPA